MKNTVYITLMILSAMLIACDDTDDIQYVSHDKLKIKTIPITSLAEPYLLPDGSLVTIATDNSLSGAHDFYRIVKLCKDGSIIKSPELSFHFEDGGTIEGRRLDFGDSNNCFCTNTDGEALFSYITPANFAVAKIDEGVALDITISNHLHGQFLGGVPLDNGSFAVITADDHAVLSVMDSNAEISRQFTLSYLLYNRAHSYKIFGLCGNIMIIDVSAETKEFYVYSPDGQYLNYGTYDYVFDKIVCVIDSNTNKFSHAYAVTSKVNILNNDDKIGEGSIITKLDSNGCIIYEYQSFEYSEIHNVAEHDGKLIIAGFYLSNYSDSFSFSEAASAVGKIVIVDAETSHEISTHTMSLEGGVMPFAAVPDGCGGYYIYMSRVFSSEMGEIGADNHYGSYMYIYRIDELDKLNNIE